MCRRTELTRAAGSKAKAAVLNAAPQRRRRSLRAITGPNFSTQRRTVS